MPKWEGPLPGCVVCGRKADALVQVDEEGTRHFYCAAHADEMAEGLSDTVAEYLNRWRALPASLQPDADIAKFLPLGVPGVWRWIDAILHIETQAAIAEAERLLSGGRPA